MMKSTLATGVVLVVACMSLCFEAACAGGSPKIKSQMDSVSYAIGMNIGKQVKKDSLALSPDLIAQGIRDAMAGKEQFTDAKLQEVMMSFNAQMMAKQAGQQHGAQQHAPAAGAEDNAKAGKQFLEQNAKQPGVISLPSGLQYQVITEGNGPIPKPTDTVVTKYKGMLIDGTEFDNSEKHGGTVSFPANQVIRGWTEALTMMKVGSKWKLYIPSDLAYGAGGAGGLIGPNATLIFDIELVGIQGK